MWSYVLRRLLLLPLTLLCILLINFVILNFAPGDPVTVSELSPDGSKKQNQSIASSSDDRYLQFRERYGLTLPVLLNTWPWDTREQIEVNLRQILDHRYDPADAKEMSLKDYNALRVNLGDRSPYVMQILLSILSDPHEAPRMRVVASQFFARGGTQQAVIAPTLTDEEAARNKKIDVDNLLLTKNTLTLTDTPAQTQQKVAVLKKWYEENRALYWYEPTFSQKMVILFFNTRISRYLSKVLTLDFGTMRNDNNKTVIGEVTRRFKYSLTLSITPMIITFFLCQCFGFIMAYYRGYWIDHSLNVFFLILYALPVFVVAPFLIETIALNHNFPFTDVPIPISGFTSPDKVYDRLDSWGKLKDVVQHLFLPILAIMYTGLAAESRLTRTAVLEVLKQDYIRTAYAKGVPNSTVLIKHVGRNAAITIVTSIAGSLGIVLGGSLIVETLFDINGFGKFFYDAIINRDYNVIMFSSLAGSFLTLMGYLVADLAYTALDPRVSLE